jgi:HSP20 family molecular chaperone IbpA
MFEKKKCPACGKKVEKEFSYCPYCGEELKEAEEEFEEFRPFSIFEDIDKDIGKELKRVDKMFSKDFFKFPKFERGGGISITIQSGTGMEPKVEVKTSGEYKKLEPEIKRRLGVKPAIEEVEEEVEKKPRRIPKVTEEPEAKIEKIGNKQRIEIKLPDVKSEKDIEVKDLEQSIEVKAFAGDKAYFKLLPIVGTVTKKEFKNGILRIEVEK